MNWPLSHEFNEAVQNPRLAFADPDLRDAEPVVGPQGLPLPRSGNFADVYQLRGADGRDWAVKCFTRPAAGLADRYARVGEALAAANLPFAVGFTFLAEGVRVGGVWRPAVKMEWVEGLLLNQVVRDNLARPAVLSALGQMWVRLCRRLREARIAHADLQHGNALMVPGSRPGAYGLKLIDYDGMHVPALANTPSGESGHPSYQHPARAATRAYSPDVDRFPHLAIAAALRGLSAAGPALWERHDNGDNLLFTEEDYRTPSRSEAMRSLWETGDPAVQSLVGRLAVACGRPIPQTPWLDQLAPDGEPIPLDDSARREAAAALGFAAPVPAWAQPEPAVASRFRAPFGGGAPVLTPVVVEVVGSPSPLAFTADADEPPKKKPAGKKRAGKVSAKRRAELRAAGPGRRAILLAAAGLVLLGVAVAGVFALGGKKRSDETARTPDEPPGQPGPAPGSPPGGGTTGGSEPKEPGPVAVPPPEMPGRAAGPVAIREKHRAGFNFAANVLKFGTDGRTVIAHSYQSDGATLDVQTGAVRALPAAFRPRQPGAVVLADGKFGGWQPWAKQITVFDLKTGGADGAIPFPDFAADPRPPLPETIRVSPDGRFVAAGLQSRTRLDPDTKRSVVQPAPLRILDTKTGKNVVETDWLSGSIFFNADSSRALVVDTYCRGQWYKLPSGEADGKWELRSEGKGQTWCRTSAASRDARVLLVHGVVDSRLAMFTLDGQTGKQITAFGKTISWQTAALSADGKVVAALEQDSAKGESRLVVLDAASGAELAREKVSLPDGMSVGVGALSPDGRWYVLANRAKAGTAVVYDLAAGGASAEELPAPKPPVPKPPAPGGAPELKALWTAPLTLGPAHLIHVDAGANLVLVGGMSGAEAFELTSGRSRAGFAGLKFLGPGGIQPLDKGRVATVSLEGEVRVWDARTGREAAKIGVPKIPEPAGDKAFLRADPSPNGKYLAVFWWGSGSPRDVPFRVFDTATKKVVLDTTWGCNGWVRFTADSSRILVTEDAGRCRWFKLPSGELGDNWTFEGEVTRGRAHRVSSASADGSVLGYNGPPGAPGANGPALVDGKTGEVLHHFRGYNSAAPVTLSSDGTRAALMNGAGLERRVSVFDVPTRTLIGSARLTDQSSGRYNLSGDGSVLIVIDSKAKTVVAFDVPAAAKSP